MTGVIVYSAQEPPFSVSLIRSMSFGIVECKLIQLNLLSRLSHRRLTLAPIGPVAAFGSCMQLGPHLGVPMAFHMAVTVDSRLGDLPRGIDLKRCR